MEDGVRVLFTGKPPNGLDPAVLERTGGNLSVVRESAGSDGLTRLATESIDCVVAMRDLADMSGIDYLRRVRDAHPDLPFILLVESATDEVFTTALERGVTDCLPTAAPNFDGSFLGDRITQAVGHDGDSSDDHHSPQYYERLLENAADIVMVVDSSGQVEYISPAIERVLGYSPTELVGTDAFETVHPDDIDIAAAAFEDVLSHPDAVQTVEYRAKRADGSWHWIEVRGRNRLDDPNIEGIIVTVRDISERKAREKALSAERERFTRLFEVVPEPLVHVEFEEETPIVRTVNQAFEDVFGYDESTIAGDSLDQYIVPAAERDQAEEINELSSGGDTLEREVTRETTDGERTFLFRVVETGIGTEANEALGIYFDITERKAREEELRRNERRFQAMLNDPNILVGLLETDGTILDANETAMKYIDAELADVLGEKIWSTPWWTEDLRPVVKQKVEAAAEGEYVSYTVDLTDSDGEPYSVTGVIRPVLDEEGAVLSLIISAMDITERREREEELAESEARYQSLTEDVLDTSEVGTFIIGPDFEVVWVNQAVEEYFNLDRAVILGMDKPTLIRDHMKDVFEASDRFERRILASYEDNTDVVEFECHVTPTDDRAERWLRHWSQPIRSGLYEGGRIEHYTDITARKKREHQLDVMDRVLRHNLHNELAVILGAAETIDDDTDGRVAEYAGMVMDSGQRLLNITSKQREIVEVVAENPSVMRVEMDQVIARCVAEIEEAYPSAEIHLTLEEDVIALALPQLDRAVIEVLENAIVHADSDAPIVEVSLETVEDTVRIRVGDSGPSIPGPERAILRGEGEGGPLYHGSGMGLWLVNWIVSTSDGRITISENDPSGNVVEIQVPRLTGRDASIETRND